MKEELQTKALEVITSLQRGVEKAGEFAAEQLPDIALQYVLFGRAWTTTLVLTGLALLALTVWAARRVRSSEESEGMQIACFVGAMVSGMFSLVFLTNLQDFFMVWFAPKLWLLLELASLLK